MAIPNFFTILLIILLFFVIFGILGINYLKGQLFQCLSQDGLLIDSDLFTTDHKWDCLNLGGEWKNSLYNFDNMLQAQNTLFQMATMSGWSNMMVTATGTTQIDYVQVQNIRPYIALFFVVFVLIGGFFLMNLFVAVVLLKFQKERDNVSGHSFLTPEQQEWVYLKLSYLSAVPIQMMRPPDNKFKFAFYKIVNSIYFQRFIFGTILLNTLLLTIKYFNQPESMSKAIEYINYIFTAIFALEALFKIIAFDLQYFKDLWNVFDFIVALGSVVSIFLTLNTSLNLGGATSILRAFRVCRILRLVKRAKNLKVVFNTFIVSLPAMTNVGGLLFLLIYLYSVLGVYLFANIAVGGAMTESLNFKTFFNAMGLLFVIATGDGWNDIMNSFVLEHSITNQCISNPTYQDYVDNGYQTIGCGVPEIGFTYFYSFFFLVDLIFLNLFIAIILDGFNQTQTKEGRELNPEVIKNFRKVWAQYDPEGNGFIPITQFNAFLFDLKKPLGWDKSFKGNSFEQVKFIHSLDLITYDKGIQQFEFIQVLDALATKVALHMFVVKKIQQMIEEKLIEENEAVIEEQKIKLEGEYYVEMDKQLKDLAENQEIQGIQIVKRFVDAVKKVQMHKQELIEGGGLTGHQIDGAKIFIKKLNQQTKKTKILRQMDQQRQAEIAQQLQMGPREPSEDSSQSRIKPESNKSKSLNQAKMHPQSSPNHSINEYRSQGFEKRRSKQNSIIEKEFNNEGDPIEEEKGEQRVNFDQNIFYGSIDAMSKTPTKINYSIIDLTRNEQELSQNEITFIPDLTMNYNRTQGGKIKKKKKTKTKKQMPKKFKLPNLGSVGGTNELGFGQDQIEEEEKDQLPFVDYISNLQSQQRGGRKKMLELQTQHEFLTENNNLLMGGGINYFNEESKNKFGADLKMFRQSQNRDINISDLDEEDLEV